jgi:hypothetical protein
MNKIKTATSRYTEIPVFATGQLSSLRCLAEIPVELSQGQFVTVIGRCTATTEDVAARGKNVNWVFRTRIEPTSLENWGLNADSTGNDDYCVVGQVGFKSNGNITPDMHHESREISDTWEVTETGTWYFKLCSRAHTSGALSTDDLDIDRLELEVLIH